MGNNESGAASAAGLAAQAHRSSKAVRAALSRATHAQLPFLQHSESIWNYVILFKAISIQSVQTAPHITYVCKN